MSVVCSSFGGLVLLFGFLSFVVVLLVKLFVLFAWRDMARLWFGKRETFCLGFFSNPLLQVIFLWEGFVCLGGNTYLFIRQVASG